MNATEELRCLLDERGVEWKDGDASHTTEWTTDDGRHCSAMYWKPTLTVLISGCTPEQAIAATLGGEQEVELQKALNKAAGNWAKADAELRKALDFMRIWINDDAHLGESELSAAFEKAEGLRKLNAIESAIAVILSTDECEQVFVDCDDGLLPPFTAHCSKCGIKWGFTPKFCPECGAKVK